MSTKVYVLLKSRSILENAEKVSRYDIYISYSHKEYVTRALERWARWCVEFDGNGGYSHLGYGKGGHHRVISGPPTGKRNITPVAHVDEERIERALWRYQDLDGFTVKSMHVEAFRLKHLTRMTNLDASEKLKISIATYKRYVANVMAYLNQEIFDELYTR